MPAYALAQSHHTRAVTGGIEGQIDSKHTTAEGVRDQCEPRSPQSMAGAGTDDLHVELGVIEMCDFEGTIAVTRGLSVELPVQRFVLVGCAPP